jgi:hypothetical protein
LQQFTIFNGPHGNEDAMDIKGFTAPVTGATKVCAGVRDLASITDRPVTPLRLDVTSSDQIIRRMKCT